MPTSSRRSGGPGGRALRVVVDTNIWVSALILPDSVPGRILSALREDRFDAVVSWELVEEVVRVLRRPKLRGAYSVSDSDIRDLVVLLSPALPGVEIDVPVRDPNDAPVIAAALTGRAEAITTGDSDLLEDSDLRAWLLERGVEVLSATELLRRLGMD